MTRTQPEERSIGESDKKAYTFWFSNPNVHVIGNVAAGAEMGGFWYEPFEHNPHGPYKNTTLWPEYAGFVPKTRPFGSWSNNVVHSVGEMGIRMYDPGYAAPGPFTFYNTRSYKNCQRGIFIHGTQNMIMDGGVFADNFISIRNNNERTYFRNLELIGTSELVRQRRPHAERIDKPSGYDGCFAKVGIQQRINPHSSGSIYENVTFSGLNEQYCTGQIGFDFYRKCSSFYENTPDE